jgi:hypothetical protein
MKNRILSQNYIFYLLSSIIFAIFYLVNNLYSSYWDALWIYQLSLKPLIDQKLYEDFSFQHGPYLFFLFESLKFFQINSFNFLLLSGIAQSLFAGYLSNLFCDQIFKSQFVKRICFLITIFSISIEYNFAFWDCYIFLIGTYSLYLIFLRKKIILGTLLLSIIFFLKQTFGFTFFLIFIFFSFIDFIFLKKSYLCIKKILYFLLFTIINLIIIFLFSDLNKFYNENVLYIFKYSEIYKRNDLLSYLLGVIFLFPDINSLEKLKLALSRDNFSLNQIIFYIMFRLPVFAINVFLIYKIREIAKNYYRTFLIIILSCILPIPLLGRGYWGTIFFFPIIPIIFFSYFFFNGNIILNFLKFNYKKFLLFYTLIIFIYLILFSLNKINFSQISDDYIIKSKKNFFLNFHKKQVGSYDGFASMRDMFVFIDNSKIKEIFVLDEKSQTILYFLDQPVLNQDSGPELSESANNIKQRRIKMSANSKDFLERFIDDINQKKPKFILYEKNDFILLNKIIDVNFFANYTLRYQNKHFSLLERN